MAGDAAVILCVEDEADLRSDLVEELQEAGYAVLEASNGDQAAGLLEQGARPDLILCDINMPGSNGYDLLERLRRLHPELGDVPFVFLTALADSREVVKGKRAGADDYLVKPVDFDLMLATVEARLRQIARVRRGTDDEMARLRSALQDLREAPVDPGGALRALDYVTLGVILLDLRGQVLFANRAAIDLSEEADGLVIAETVRSGWGANSAALRKTLESAAASARKGEERVFSTPLARPSGRRDILLVACPMDVQEKPSPTAAAMVVFVSDPERRTHVPDGLLANLFGLTPAESQIAMKLAAGMRLDEIRQELGISQTTVAYHMRNLFQKTSTNRQADLIALVLAGPMAIDLKAR